MKKTFLLVAVLMLSLMICFTACDKDKKKPVETTGVETVETNEPDAPSTEDIGDEETTVATPDESEPIETETDGTDSAETDSEEVTQHTHAWGDWTTVKEASCTEPGTEERKCDCGETEQQTVAAIGHTESVIPAVAPTCTESGLTAGKLCTVCNEVLEAQNEIAAAGHTEGTAATCTTAATCSVCGQQYGEVVGHVYDQETVKTEALKSEATCASAAVYYKSCTCGAVSTADEDTFTDGEALAHVYDQETVKAEALKSEASCGNAAVYYKSCTCGAVSTADEDTFTDGDALVHVYDQETVKAEALKSEATCESAAVYYKSCICGAVSTADEDTFTDGEALAHVYDQETVKAEALKSEATCASAAVYYKSCTCGAVSTSDTDTFTSGEAAAHTYDQQNTAIVGAKVLNATCTRAAVYKKSCVCGALSTNYADTFTSGAPNGHRGGTATCTTQAICSICGNAYGNLGQHKYTVEKATEATLKSPATCTSRAVYKKSCECDAISENENDTFTYGETLAHTYEREVVKPETVMTPADCTSESEAVYYLSCLYCDDYSQDPEETFTAGGITHDYVQNAELDAAWVSDATCQSAAVYKLSCSKCDALSEETFEYGGAVDCDFSDENPVDGALKSPATCTSAAVYYRSCVYCGEVDVKESNTFESGETLTHEYSAETAKADAFVSEATCVSAAVYVKSCVHCGAVDPDKSNTFKYGDALAHVCEEDEEAATEATCDNPATKTFRCTNDGCQYFYTNEVSKALGHNIEGVERTEVLVEGTTCTYNSYYPCQNYGCTEKVELKQVFKHTYKASITTPATCQADGVKTLTCSKEGCGDTQTEKIEKSELYHQWNEGTLNGSVRIHECTEQNCDETKSVTVYEGNSTGSIGVDDLKNEIELNGANISMDDGVIDAIGGQEEGKTVDVSAEQLDEKDREDLLTEEQLKQVGDNPIYNFTISDGTNNISSFGETNWVTITLPYTLAPGEDVDSIAIWFISDDGQLESFKATYSEGYVTFKTNHFSYYTVTRLTPEERCNLYGHNYVTAHVEGSCTTDEYDLAVCVRCHYTEQQNLVKASGHVETTTETPATCTTDGSIVTTCENCDDYRVENKIPKTGHKWTEENLEPTCSADGYKRLTCSKCGTVSEEKKDKLPHEMSATEEVIKATCDTEGYTVYKCANCDHAENRDYVKATGHSYKAVETDGWSWAEDYSSAAMSFVCEHNEEHVLDKTASVNSTVVTLVCSEGYSETTYTATLVYGGTLYTDTQVVVIGEIKHTYSGKWLTDETTHWQKCSCGENSEKVAHSFSADWTVGEGAHWHECECGYRTDVAVHTFENATVTTQPSCIFEGESTAYCACGAMEFTPVPATGVHKYENGYCIECGKSEESDRVPFIDAYIREGLVAWYDGANNANGRQNMMATVWKDLSGNMNHIDLSDAMAAGHVYWGKNAFIIDTETGCSIQLPDAVTEMINGQAYTIEIVYGDVDYTATSYITLISASNDELSMFIRCSDGENMKLEYKNGDANGDGNRPYMYDAWYFIDGRTLAITADLNAFDGVRDMYENPDQPGNVFLYSDGTMVSKGESEFSVGADHLNLGHTDERRRWGGEIYAIRIYDRALTPEELEANASADEQNYRNGTIFEPQEQYDPSMDTDEGCAHDSIQTNVLQEPTCGATGLMEMTCVACNTTVTVKIPATGEHDFANGSCKDCGTAHDCSYEVSYELLGDSCEDGVKLIGTCYCGATAVETVYEHLNLVTAEIIDMSAYESCGGDFGIQRCPCGARGYIVLLHSNHDWTVERSPIPSENGDVATYICNNCDVTWVVTSSFIETDNPCRVTYHRTIEVKWSNSLVGTLTLDVLEENHEYIETAQLVEGATSCEQGVIVTGVCSVCENVSTRTITWHEWFTKERIDLSAIGACGGFLVQEGCACGAEGYTGWDEFQCGWMTDRKTTTDENGREITIDTNTCVECGLTWTETYYYEDTEDPCFKQRFIHVVYTMDGETVCEMNHSERQSFHELEYSFSFADGVTSCEGGVTVIQECVNCDYSWERTLTRHQYYEVESIDLSSEFGACGGFLTLEKCPCGEMSRLNWNELVCDFVYDKESGIGVCSKCQLSVEETGTTGKGETSCEVIRYQTITLLKGEKTRTLSSQRVSTSHRFIGTWEGEIESCLNGVEVTRTCYKCGYSGGKYTIKDHEQLLVDYLDFTEVGGCGGGFGVYSCPCGENTGSWYDNPQCDFVWVESDQNGGKGHEACRICGLIRSETNTAEKVPDSCKVIYRGQVTISKDNNTASLSYERTGTEHEYTYDWGDGVSSEVCAKGFEATATCKHCQYSEKQYFRGHNVVEVKHLDVKDIGGCGGIFAVYSCPCGQEGWAYWENRDCDFTWTYDKELKTSVGTCSKCQMTITEPETTEKVEGTCNVIRHGTITVSKGGETRTLTYSRRSTEHQFVGTWEGTVDSCLNGVTVTMTCQKCKESGGTRFIKEHDTFMVECLDYTTVGGCGGEYVVYRCPCGENFDYWSRSVQCDFERVYDEKNQTSYEVCRKCEMTLKRVQTTQKLENSCKVIYNGTVTISKDGKSASLSYQGNGAEHEYTYSWDEGVQSCLNGVKVTGDCRYCDQVDTYTINNHNTYMVDCLDFTTVGGCGGEFRVYSCPCGEQAHTNRHYDQCQFEWKHDKVTGTEVGTCTKCGMTFVQEETRTEVENSCKVYYSGKVTISKDGDSESLEYAYTERQHQYTYEWDKNVESCTDGITYTATCKYADCGYSYSDKVTDHHTYGLAVYNLADYKACGGTLTYYSCFCGKEGHLNRDFACNYTYTGDSYYDKENGRTVEVRTYVCKTCGMRDTRSWYVEKATDACEEIRYYTETVSVGDTLVGDFIYQDRYTSHDWEYTYKLNEGSNTCEDGVTVSGVCKDCHETSSYTTNSHERFEVSRIEFESVCGGYATEYNCACGQNHGIDLYEHVNCDFGIKHINYEDLWFEGAINGSQFVTDGGYYYRESYGRLYTCAVTDPPCAYQIRYASYWLPVEDEKCVIAQYEIWQFGYNANGTCEKEIVIATGRRAQWHDYVEAEVSETWEGNENLKTLGQVYTCSVCQSTYSDLKRYDENGEPVKWEEIAVNKLDNEFNKQYDCVRIQYSGQWVMQLEVFKYADGTMRTSNYSYNDCTQTQVVTERDGTTNTWTQEHCVTTWRWDPMPTCTQFGKEVYVCAICSTEIGEVVEYKPNGHHWYQLPNGVYECSTCRLESANGADGTIVMEDLSTATDYIVGYWNKSNVEFTKYVSIVMADGTAIDLEGIVFADETNICAISFSKAAVEAAAATAVAGTDYEGAAYDVRFTFVPYGADSNFDYAITFTNEVTEAVPEAA